MNTLKTAGSDQDFEKSLFSISFDKLQNKLFNLMPFFVGFELVKKSDDGTKAVGVFAFKSQNGQILFVPVFFINGKVRELDMMYSRNNNQMYPLNEDYAELFMKDDVTGLGNVADESREDIRRSTPALDFRDLTIPPRTGRNVVASVTEYLTDSDNNVKQAFWNVMEKNADFTEAVRRFYSDEEIARSLLFHPVKQAADNSKVRVLTFKDVESKDTPPDTKAKLIERGYAILDGRSEPEKYKFGVVDITKNFTNPQSSGFYTYVTELGTLRQGLVLMTPHALYNGIGSSSTLVVDLESKVPGKAYEVDHPVFIKDQISIKDYSDVYNKMDNAADALPSFSAKYVLVNEKFYNTEPFCVVENYQDASGVRRLVVEPENLVAPRSISGSAKDKVPRQIVLVFTKKGGDHLEYRGKTVYVPKGFKLLRIRTSSSTLSYSDSTEAERKAEAARIREGKPGTINNVTEFLREKGVVPMSLHTNGSDYFVNVAAAKKKYPNPIMAKIGMVVDYGLDQDISNELIDSLVPDIEVHGIWKKAYLGDQTLPLMDEEPATNELGQPTYYGIPYQQVADTGDHYTGNPTSLDHGTMGHISTIDQDVNQAIQMANAGQKQIFDTQAIATMAKYVDPSNKVLSYIPDFVSTLDNLGRMLFMIQWETDKFEEMYGTDEIPELIELIKSVFKNLGDLVIFMKRKFPDISINGNEQGIDQA